VLRCREIREDDIDNLVVLLTRGFASGRDYWTRALGRLRDHPTPPGLPKYGYVLDDDGALVGVLLLIFTDLRVTGESRIRCNISSWYVDPAYRSYGSLLALRAIRHKDATFFNTSPAPHTWPILEKQGFVPFATGRTIAIPALALSPTGARVQAFQQDVRPGQDLNQAEIDVLGHHANYGCLSMICEVDGERHPFVFGVDRRYRLMPIAHLVYCRNLREFVRLAGPLGRFLARRGCIVVKFNSNGPTRGIVGKHYPGGPKYRKGGDQIRPGDVAYSEQAMFGY